MTQKWIPALTLVFCTTLTIPVSSSLRVGQPSSPSVSVSGAVKHPLTFTAKDLAALPRTEVTVNDHGKSATYEGVLLSAVLEKVGAPLGEELRGKALASYVLATASDGYQVLFALAELEPSLTNARVLLAEKMDGKPLPETSGPFRIVAPDDKKMARSVRMLEKLEVVRLRP